MITQHDLAQAQAAADQLFPELTPAARHPLDASPVGPVPSPGRSEESAPPPAPPALIQGSSAAQASAADTFSRALEGRVTTSPQTTPSHCETELHHMVEVQREILTTLQELLPDCALAGTLVPSTKTRILVSELLRVTEEQSSFILGIKTQLAMRDLANLKL